MMIETIEIQTPECSECHRSSTLRVPSAGYDAWQAGAFIQDAFPSLTDDEREMLKTGIHPDCWDALMESLGCEA